MAIAKKQKENPKAFIENKKLFGDLAQDERFSEPDLNTLRNLHTESAQKTLELVVR